MQYTTLRKEKNEQVSLHIGNLAKTINDMAEDAVRETLKECANQTFYFPEDLALWGVDTNGDAIKVKSLSLDNNGNVCYSAVDEEGNYFDGVIEIGDIVRFDWADVLYTMNDNFDYNPCDEEE